MSAQSVPRRRATWACVAQWRSREESSGLGLARALSKVVWQGGGAGVVGACQGGGAGGAARGRLVGVGEVGVECLSAGRDNYLLIEEVVKLVCFNSTIVAVT